MSEWLWDLIGWAAAGVLFAITWLVMVWGYRSDARRERLMTAEESDEDWKNRQW
jgi:hypothetical protein